MTDEQRQRDLEVAARMEDIDAAIVKLLDESECAWCYSRESPDIAALRSELRTLKEKHPEVWHHVFNGKELP